MMILIKISGVGPQKLERYGDKFIEVIQAFEQSQPNLRQEKKRATHLITFNELEKGMSPDQVANIRQLNVETIYAHICTLYEQGKVKSIRPHLTSNEEAKILNAIKELGDDNKLKTLFDYFDGEMPYHKLRLGLSVYGQQLL